MSVCDYDSNTINTEMMKTRMGTKLRVTYQNIHKHLRARDLNTKMHILDNECATIFKEYTTKVEEEFQLVPPHMHMRSTAERAIQIFNDHFIAGLFSVNKAVVMHIWCRMLPRAIITSNLLQPSRI